MAAILELQRGKWRCGNCGKVAYRSEEAGTDAAFKISARMAGRAADGPARMRPYFGKKCGWWHVTKSGGAKWYSAQLRRNVACTNEPVTKIVFRDYQTACKKHLFDYFVTDDGNPIAALPTGTGKSLIIGGFIHEAVTKYPGTRVMMLTHVKELIKQNLFALLSLWPTAPVGVYSAGLNRKESNQDITYAGIASVHRKPELFGHIDLILVDECHLINPKSATMYRKFFEALREVNPSLKIIGFTATAYRLGQGMLTDADSLFTDVAFDLTERDAFNWMIAQGWISRLIPKQTKAVLDVSGVKMQGGEFVLKQLQGAVDKDSITIAAISESIEQAQGRDHILVFASGIEHTEHITDFFNDSFDISATCVHSKLSDTERDERIADFKAGKYRVMVNNNILTTGFDYPDIDCIIMLRPTASPGLWVQMLGRGTRPIYAQGWPVSTAEERLAAIAAGPKKNCLVLDFAGNTRRLGPINDPVLPRTKGKGPKGIAPVRLCEHCGCYSHASCRFCENPECGMEFPVNIKISSDASIQQLIVGSMPEIAQHHVAKVIYTLHKKKGKPDSMKVTYYTGLRKFNEYVCLDHGGYAARIARQWWQLRCPWGIPPDVAAGLLAVDYLKVPKSISIIENKRYPEVAGYEFE